MSFNVAIDGPAGAGKSTIAKRVAKELNFVYVDTGAMFRAMALYCLNKQYDISKENEVSKHVNEIDIRLAYENGSQIILLNGEDVSTQIREERVGNGASCVAKYAAVRNKLKDLQQKIAKETDIIMDGRDIGTCVLPKAQVKFYLTATADCRAKRRYKELMEKGVDCNLEEIKADIIARDEQDMNREIAPLKQADDAILVDSSSLTIDQVVDLMKHTIREELE